uniref:Ionotropic receptor n=1 Tax=Stomoxys calcitrans TaxID=35570 RepID=A0A905ST49_STOCA
MNWKLFAFMAFLLLQIGTTKKPSRKFISSKSLKHLINNLGAYWNMSSIYIVCNAEIAHKRFIRNILEELHRNESYFGQRPHLAVSDQHIVMRFYEDKYFSSNSLVLTLMHSIYDDVLQATINATRHRRTCFSIFYVEILTHSTELQRFFGQLWKYQMRRPLVIVNGGDLLTMYPYPTLSIINVSDEHYSKMFPRYKDIQNFNGYAVNMPIQTHLPYTFWYVDENTQKYKMDGMSGWIVSEFMQRLNVSFKVYPLYSDSEKSNYLDMTMLSDLLLSGQIELSPHLVSMFVQMDLDYSYPFITTSRCVMMPLPPREPSNFILIQWPLWLAVCICFGLLEVIMFLYVYLTRRPGRRDSNNSVLLPNMQNHFLLLLTIILALPMPSMRLPTWKQTSALMFLRLLCIYFVLRFGGFYLAQMLSTNLTSMVTSSYLKTPTMQMDDFLSSSASLMVNNFKKTLFMKQFHNFDQKRLVNATQEEINLNRGVLNPAFIFFVSVEEFDVINEQQKYLNPKRFILLDICHGSYPFQMQLRADSHFTELLKMFILRIRENGMYYHHKEHLSRRAKRFGKMDYIREEKKPRDVELEEGYNVNSLNAMLLVLSVGYSCSIVVFICELYGKRVMRKLKQSG